MKPAVILIAVAAAAVGAAAALYFYCPVLCRAKVKGTAEGLLSKFLPTGLAHDLASDIPI